jgi:ketosteroid isomerase-like protein
MRSVPLPLPLPLALVAVVIVTACATSAPATDPKADEAAIRALDEQWSAAANKRDLEATLAFYSAAGATMWPDAPTSHGAAEIRAAWTELFKVPGISLKFVPDKISIAQAGDLATDEGRAVIGVSTPAGQSVDTTKYLVIWRKENGTWKVLYDSYSSNKPAAPPPPPAKKG